MLVTLNTPGRNSGTSPYSLGMLLMTAVCLFAGLYELAVGLGLLAILPLGISFSWQLDTRTRQYRHGPNLFGLHLGSAWKRLPEVQRVVVRYFSDFAISGNRYSGGEELENDQRYIVLLSVPESSQGLIVAQVSQQQQALQLGRQLGQALVLDVLECDRYGELRMLQEANPTAESPAHASPYFEPAPSPEA